MLFGAFCPGSDSKYDVERANNRAEGNGIQSLVLFSSILFFILRVLKFFLAVSIPSEFQIHSDGRTLQFIPMFPAMTFARISASGAKSSISVYLIACIHAYASSATPISRPNKPPAFILTGDSTTAALSSGGGGWGNGFLTTLHNGAIGSNHGYDGATTSSFLNTGGLWQDAIEQVPRYASGLFTPYVTIQVYSNKTNK